VCDAREARCVECTSDPDCAAGTCDVERHRCRLPCTGPQDCEPRKPICDDAGLCVECSPDAACTDPKRPACTPERQCVECLSDEHCTEPGRRACRNATQRCGGCTRDEHCGSEQRCDLMAARCVPSAPVPMPAPPRP
jgi:hypothetical protein